MNASAHVLWALANSLWQSAAIAVLVQTALRFAPRTSAALRYAIWGTVLLATALLPVINLAQPARVVAVSPQRPAVAFRARALPQTYSIITPVPAKSAKAKAPIHVTFSQVWSVQPEGLTTRATDWVRTAAPSLAFWIADRAGMFLAAWALVSGLLLVRLGAGFIKLRRIKRGLLRVEALEPAGGRDASPRAATVGASSDVECPCVIGYARPVVALPARLVSDLEPIDLRRVLAHEFGHVRRWDDWANLVQQVIRALFVFNPAVHFACRELDVNREIACDDLVAAAHADRIEYAKCLTEIARRTTFAEHLAPAAGFFPDRSQIVVRIEKLLDRDHAGSPRLGLIPAATAVLLTLAALALAKHQVPAFAMSAPAPAKAATTPEPPVSVTIPRSASHALPASRAIVKANAAAAIAPAVAPANARKAVAATFKTLTTLAAQTRMRVDAAKQTFAIAQARVAPIAAAAVTAAASATASTSSSDDFLDALAAAGYTHLSVDDLIAIRNAGVTSEYLRALKAAGVLPMPASKLIALADAGVDSAYIAAMRGAGYGNLNADDLIALRNAGVDPQLASSMTQLLHQRPSPNELRSLANAGVSASYVATLAKSGYANLSAASLVTLANAGVSSGYVTEMAKQGYSKMSVDTLTALANAGVSPAYVRSLSNAGYSGVSADDLIRMANAGVTAKLITSLRSHGIGTNGNLSIDELIKLANEGF